jgi:hypothetical protein
MSGVTNYYYCVQFIITIAIHLSIAGTCATEVRSFGKTASKMHGAGTTLV